MVLEQDYLNKASDLLNEALLNKSIVGLDSIKEVVDKAQEWLAVRITTDQFEEGFLPLFTGETPKYPEVNFYTYSNFVGGPNRELILTDSTGKDVLIVPPLFDRDKIKFDLPRDPQNSLFELMGRVGEVSSRIPMQGNRLFLAMTSRKWDDIKNKDIYLKVIQDWNKVFSYFGREVITIEGLSNEELGIPNNYKPKVLNQEQPVEIRNNVTPSSNSRDFLDLDEEYDS